MSDLYDVAREITDEVMGELSEQPVTGEEMVREMLEVLRRCGSEEAAWLLAHGRSYPYADAPLPPDVERGRFKDCYANAATNVLLGPAGQAGFEYAEGYAWCGMIPVQHAWLVGPDGRVVDPTWVHDGVCGYCLGEGGLEGDCVCEVDPEDRDYGIDCYGCEREPEACWSCGGSGESTVRDSHEREYFGAVIPADLVRRSVSRRKVWGAIDDEEVRAVLG